MKSKQKTRIAATKPKASSTKQDLDSEYDKKVHQAFLLFGHGESKGFPLNRILSYLNSLESKNKQHEATSNEVA